MGDPLLKMVASCDQFTKEKQGKPQRNMGVCLKRIILCGLTQTQEIFRELEGRLELRHLCVERPEAEQHLRALRRISYLVAELSGTGISRPHAWFRPALGSRQSMGESDLERELL